MTITQLPPTRFVAAFPCPSWCGPACEKRWEDEENGHLTEVGVHSGDSLHFEGGAPGDSNAGITVYLNRIDLDDDHGHSYIAVQVGDARPFESDAGFLTPARARQVAAALMNLADVAEGSVSR